MRVRLHDGRTDPPALRPLLEALDLNVVAPGDDRGADIALWNLSTSPQAAAAEFSDLLIARDPERLPRVVLVPEGQSQIERTAYEAGVEVVLRRPLSASLLRGALDQRDRVGLSGRRSALPQLVLVAGADPEIIDCCGFLRGRDDVVMTEARGPAEIGAALRQFDFDVCIFAARLDTQSLATTLLGRMRRAQPETVFVVFDSRAGEEDAPVDLGEAVVVDGACDERRMRAVWDSVLGRIDRVRATRELHGEIADKQRELQRVNATLRNINKAFRDANLRLEREGHVKDELIGVAAHELKSPLAAMKCAIEMLTADRDRFAAEDLSMLDLLGRNTARMIKLVEDILDLARIEAGRMKINRQPVSPGQLVEQAVTMVAPRALQKGVQFDVDEGPGVMVSLDAERVVQILINLLDNAVKFSPRKGIVRVLVRLARGEIHLVVADAGPGIPQEERKAVFERFNHRSRGDDPHSGGSGLGLTITRALAELLGGRVTLGESPTGGAQFVVSLPRSH
ncbi:MAG: HAMP domain-containing histidine kinase [Planctomycetes bacterium]|nr:HAMP domain-containing histidine kinase [Planctomycetota bacterium]